MAELMDDPGEGMPAESLYTAFWRERQFRADPAVRFDAEQMPMRLSIMFTMYDDDLPRNALGGLGGDLTYFGGRPAYGTQGPLEWPRRASGKPLSHVLQVDLAFICGDFGDEEVIEATGLPPTGLLQFFHDVHTYGDEEQDRDAWLVRWVPYDEDEDIEDGTWHPTPTPPDLEPDAQRPPVALAGEISVTIPSYLDVDLSPEEKERYVPLAEWTNEHPYYQNAGRRPEDENPLTPWDEGFEPLDAPSRLCGFSDVEFNEDYDELLQRYLPLDPSLVGDTRVLLADIHVRQLNDGEDWVDWAHGGRHVEFWMRASDLAARRFDKTWALIRTDH